MRVLFYVETAPSGPASARVAIAAARGPRGARASRSPSRAAEGSRLEQRARPTRASTTVTIGGSRRRPPAARGTCGACSRDRFDRGRDRHERARPAHRRVGRCARRARRRAAARSAVRAKLELAARRQARAQARRVRSHRFHASKDATEATLTGWAIPPCVAPLGVDAAPFDAVEPCRAASIGAVQRRAAHRLLRTIRRAAHRIATVFRTLALLAPRHPELHVVVFGPGSLDEELRMHAAALGVNASSPSSANATTRRR